MKKRFHEYISRIKKVIRQVGTMGEIYLFNLFMILLVFIVNVFIINYSYSKQNKLYHMEYNYSALKGIQALLKEQEREFMDAVNSIYIDQFDENSLFNYLSSLDNKNREELITSPFSSFFTGTFSDDYGAQIIYAPIQEMAFVYTNKGTSIYLEPCELMDGMREVYEDYTSKLLMTSDTFSNTYEKKRSYGLIYCIRNIMEHKNIGAIQYEYKTKVIDSLLAQSYPSVKGDFLIVSEDGEVFYDTTEMWYDKKYPYVKQLMESTDNTKAVKLGNQRYYVNSFHKGMEFYPSLYVFSMISDDEIYRDALRTTRVIMYILMGLFLLLCVAMFLNIRKKTYLLKQLHDAMRTARQGNLNVSLDTSGMKQNELTDIAESFNKMTAKLQDYIHQEYQLKMEQQEYLLMTMQAQLNPHFLFNSFEAIRMKAMLDGNEEIEQMILILSKIFYNAAKGENVITIEMEVENCERYLQLHKIRFKQKLSYAIDIPEELEQYAIICYALQVVVENYMVYSFDSSRDNNYISIVGRKKGEHISIAISDNSEDVTMEKLDKIRSYANCTENADHRKHIGLSNMCRSMSIVFGADFQFAVDGLENGGLCQTLTFRACEKEDLKNGV